MGRIKEILQAYRTELASVIRNEYKAVFTDGGVLLVMVLAIFIYSTLYASAYAPEVLRNVPIGVIDESQTPSSRELIRTFDAGPNTYVAYEPSGMEEAEELFFARKIYGVVYIPQDYEKQLLGGSSAAVSLYVDASYFLMYRQVFQELVTGIGQTGAMVQFQRLIAKGADIPQATAATQPVIYQSHNLFIPYLGYGSFIMPAIIIVIIQQTLLIGIGMIGGTWREFGLYRKLIPANCKRMYTLPIVLGKALVYISIYAVTLLYIMTVHYKLRDEAAKTYQEVKKQLSDVDSAIRQIEVENVRNTGEDEKSNEAFSSVLDDDEAKAIAEITETSDGGYSEEENTHYDGNKRNDNSSNSNSEIIALYKKGISILEISKMLSIGQGEVKLVVDLYNAR